MVPKIKFPFRSLIVFFTLFVPITLKSQSDSTKVEFLDGINGRSRYLINCKPEFDVLRNGILYNGVDSIESTIEIENQVYVLIWHIIYQNGIKIRLIKRYKANDRLNSDQHFTRFGINGNRQSFYPTGEIYDMSYWENGVIKSPALSFEKDGSLRSVSYYDGDFDKRVLYTTYYKSGKLKFEARHLTKNEDGPFDEIDYFENGQIKMLHRSNQGRQTYFEYHEDGKLAFMGDFVNNFLCPTGKHVTYFKNGNKRSEKYYLETLDQSKTNIKTGTWKFYNEKGKIIEKQEYSK